MEDQHGTAVGSAAVPGGVGNLRLAVGADLVEVRRIAELVARYGERFTQRVFTAQELADSGGRPESLAARWAAKEAAAKALGCGIGPVSWTDIEVVCAGPTEAAAQLSADEGPRADADAAEGATADEKGHCEERSDEAVSDLRGRRRLLRSARNDPHRVIFTAGKPTLRLRGRAAALAAELGLTVWDVSLAHDAGLALAFVVGLGDPGTRQRTEVGRVQAIESSH